MRVGRVLVLRGIITATAGLTPGAWGQPAMAPPVVTPVSQPPERGVRLAAQLGFGVLTPVDSIGGEHNQGDLAGELSIRAATAGGWQPHLRVIWGSVVPAGLPAVGVRLWTLGLTRRWEPAGDRSWIIPYLGGGVGIYSTAFVTRPAVSADAGVEFPLGRRVALVGNGSFELAFTGKVYPKLLTLTIGAQLSTN